MPPAEVMGDQLRSSTLVPPTAKRAPTSPGSRWALNPKFISSSPMQASMAAVACARASAPRSVWASSTSPTPRPAMSRVSTMLARWSEYSGWIRPPASRVMMPCGMVCSMTWMSAVFWRTSSVLCWIFSTIRLKAVSERPISSMRATGTRCEKSWLVAISVILRSISPMGRTICRYSMKPMPPMPSTATRVIVVSSVVVSLRLAFSEAMASSLPRRFSTCTASIIWPSSRRYWSTVAAMVASAASCWPASLNFAVSSMAWK